MIHPQDFFHFYIGVETNSGRLISAGLDSCTVQQSGGEMIEVKYADHFNVRLHLRKIKDLSNDESAELIRKGMSIGRPRGYSFSPEAFVYLLSRNIDLFGLIESKLAIHTAG